MLFSVWSYTRRVLCCVGLTGAVITAGIVTTTLTSRGQVLALPGPTESTVVTVDPTRVLDTRVPVGLAGKLVAATPQNLQITGSIDTWTEATQTNTSRQVVPTGATGVLMNVTAVSPTASGYLSVRPGNATGVPATAGLNFAPGDIIPNAITVALPTTGEINLYYGASAGATIDIVIDIVGYTTNTGLIDLVNRLTALETSRVAGPAGTAGTNGTNGTNGTDGTNGTNGTNGVDAESPDRVIWVANDGTGDHALLSTALAAIPDAEVIKPYVIEIAPGVYTETANVELRAHIDVEGSGQDITTINCACSSDTFNASSAVISAGAITAEIRHLTINNTGDVNVSKDYSTGLFTENVADGLFSVLHVTTTATGGTTSFGVYNNSSSPKMNNVTATATSGTNNYGVYNISTSSPTIRNSSVTGDTNSIFNTGTSPSAQVADSMLDGAVQGAGITCVGAYNTAFVALSTSCT